MKQIVICLSLLALIVSLDSEARPPNNKGGKPNKEAHENKEDREDLKDLEQGLDLIGSLISAGDARDIARSAGATGYKPLPNGIRKNLARGKPLPPGIEKSRMPGSVLDRLPKKNGYEWRTAGTDLVLVQAGTELVADVLKDVFK